MGPFQFRVMAYGLHSAGVTFQRFFDQIIGFKLNRVPSPIQTIWLRCQAATKNIWTCWNSLSVDYERLDFTWLPKSDILREEYQSHMLNSDEIATNSGLSPVYLRISDSNFRKDATKFSRTSLMVLQIHWEVCDSEGSLKTSPEEGYQVLLETGAGRNILGTIIIQFCQLCSVPFRFWPAQISVSSLHSRTTL